ncbi:ARM repeat-containing protein [Rickenella mellea]|uniref:ARM repeat-containing protein n=1 Tax=Rickenella mellea TaxID=50990 RepID=A0A4R5XI40_9AGAM|nr:ARM repeat-containing protein [Rickenella mellea]
MDRSKKPSGKQTARSKHAAPPVKQPSAEPQIHRKARALLNKLTRGNFDSILLQIVSLVDMSDAEQYRDSLAFIGQFILKQAMDDRFSEVYARISHRMTEKITREVREHGRSVGKGSGTIIVGGLLFRNLLVNLCQSGFGGIWRAPKTTTGAMEATTVTYRNNHTKRATSNKNANASGSSSSQIVPIHRPSLVRFIGRLYIFQVISEDVVHACIKALLDTAEHANVCALLSISGKTLDTYRGRKFMDEVFARIKVVNSRNIAPRNHFMLQDIIELRERQWTPRHSVVPPTATAQVQAVTDNGVSSELWPPLTKAVDKLSLGNPKRSKPPPITSAMIDILPPEILVSVFEAGMTTWHDSRNPYPWQLRVSSVSRHWRELAISTPQMWAKIHIDSRDTSHPEWLPVWIERSAAYPLDISLDLKLYDAYQLEQSFKEHVFPQILRWRRVSIHAAREESVTQIFSCLRDASASVLQELEIRVGDIHGSHVHISEHSMHPKIMSGGTPSLYSVRISGLCLHCSKFAQGLTTMDIGGEVHTVGDTTFRDLKEVFAASPALRNLIIRRLDIDFSENDKFSLIEIPKLSSLTVDFEIRHGNPSSNVEFFSHLSLPVLERLEILRISETEFLALLRRSQPRYPTIQNLTLVHCNSHCETLSNFLKLFPVLKHQGKKGWLCCRM